MESQHVLNQLTEQVAALTRQVAELQQQVSRFEHLLGTETREAAPPPLLHIRCATLSLCSPEEPNQTQAVLAAGSAGPALTFFGTDGSTRIHIEVQPEHTRCSLYAGEKEPSVEFGA